MAKVLTLLGAAFIASASLVSAQSLDLDYDPGRVHFQPKFVKLKGCGFGIGADPRWEYSLEEKRNSKGYLEYKHEFRTPVGKGGTDYWDRHGVPFDLVVVNSVLIMSVSCSAISYESTAAKWEKFGGPAFRKLGVVFVDRQKIQLPKLGDAYLSGIKSAKRNASRMQYSVHTVSGPSVIVTIYLSISSGSGGNNGRGRKANTAAGKTIKERLNTGEVLRAELKYPITREKRTALNYRLRSEQENTELVMRILQTIR